MTRLIPLILCIVAWAFSSHPAQGHAVLLETQPADGAVLAAAPFDIVLRFNEPIAPVLLRVVGPDGKAAVDTSAARVTHDTIRISVPEGIPNGTYVASFRVISIDSHPVAGAIVFSIGSSGTSPPVAPTAAEGNSRITAAVVRGLFVFLLLLASGGALALWLIFGFSPDAIRHSKRVILGASLSALATSVLSLGATGCRLLDAPLTALLVSDPWRVAAASTFGLSLTIADVGLILLLLSAMRLDHRYAGAVAVGGALIALSSFAFTGHAATTSPAWLMVPAVAVHATCAAFWVGSLYPLLRSLPGQDAYMHLGRFSTQAVISVGLILVLGVVIAIVQVRQFGMLWESAYGLTLSAKFGAVALLLAAAAHNKWRTTPLLRSDAPRAKNLLRKTIAAEYLLFAVIIALTAALGQMQPPRAMVEHPDSTERPQIGSADFRAIATESGYKIGLLVAPALTGHSAILVDVTDATNKPIEPKSVTVELSLPAVGIEAIRRNMQPESPGRFVYHSDDLVVAGRWTINVRVLIDDFNQKDVTFDVPIK